LREAVGVGYSSSRPLESSVATGTLTTVLVFLFLLNPWSLRTLPDASTYFRCHRNRRVRH